MTLYEMFSQLEDPRIERCRLHLLEDIIMLVLCGTIAGAQHYHEIASYGYYKHDMLKGFLKLPNGIPSSVTLWRVFERLDASALEGCLRQYGQGILAELADKHISLDGKQMRGTGNDIQANLHVVSAWLNGEGLTLGQQVVGSKSNEKTAIPELLKQLDVSGSLVSIDAMGCSPTIAEIIIDEQADYLLALKANNGFLYEQVRDRLNRALEGYTGDDPPWTRLHTEVDFGHGRLERRSCYVSDQLQWIDGAADWKDLGSIAVVESERESKDKSTIQRRYYLCSLTDATAQQVLQWSRNHWGIENNLHWVLDVAFGEDQSKVSTGQGPINLATVRKLAMRIIQEDKQMKGSFKTKRKIAGWNDEYMKNILRKVIDP